VCICERDEEDESQSHVWASPVSLPSSVIILKEPTRMCCCETSCRHSVERQKVFVSRSDGVVEYRQFTQSYQLQWVLIFSQNLTVMGPRKINKILFCELELDLCVGLTSPPSVSRLSTQCQFLYNSQTYEPLRPVTGIALPLICR
jgi:hypothetical protein